MLFDLVAVVRNQIGSFFDVAEAFEAILADLVAHQRREMPPVSRIASAIPAHVCQPLLPGQRGPRRIRRTRGGIARGRAPACPAGSVRAERCVDWTAIVELWSARTVLTSMKSEMLAAERLGALAMASSRA